MPYHDTCAHNDLSAYDDCIPHNDLSSYDHITTHDDRSPHNDLSSHDDRSPHHYGPAYHYHISNIHSVSHIYPSTRLLQVLLVRRVGTRGGNEDHGDDQGVDCL